MAFTMSDPSAELDPFEAEAAIDAPQWVTAGEPASGLGVHGVDPVPAAPPPGAAFRTQKSLTCSTQRPA